MFQGSLPLVVIFDVAEEQCRVEGDAATRLMDKHRVYVSVRRKPKQGIASVVIKGIERCAGVFVLCRCRVFEFELTVKL